MEVTIQGYFYNRIRKMVHFSVIGSRGSRNALEFKKKITPQYEFLLLWSSCTRANIGNEDCEDWKAERMTSGGINVPKVDGNQSAWMRGRRDSPQTLQQPGPAALIECALIRHSTINRLLYSDGKECVRGTKRALCLIDCSFLKKIIFILFSEHFYHCRRRIECKGFGLVVLKKNR